jgi:amidohydrolase
MGVVGLLKGNTDGRTILLRADMDALPLEEETDLSFKSKNPGLMHACGHDVHTSILLGAAKVLSEVKEHINGNIKFVFQPAEEASPTGGARYMIEDGVLENPKVDAALALHVWNLPLGKVGLKPGPIMAQSDRIFIKVKGSSSHASQPQHGIDAIVASGYIITALQTIVSRNLDPMESAVITIGKINGGTRYNVISDTVTMEGTVRIFDPIVADMIPKRIREVVNNVSLAFGCECELEYVKGYSLLSNDEKLTFEVVDSLKEAIGEDNVIIAEKPSSGGEDFSAFTSRVPSVYFWLGMVSDLNKNKSTIHNPNLVVDEKCIPIGIKAMVYSAINFLNK